MNEALFLEREALQLQLPGHLHCGMSRLNVGLMLSVIGRSKLEGEPQISSSTWSDVVSMHQEAVYICPAGISWRAELFFQIGARLLVPADPIFDLEKGISHIFRGLSDDLGASMLFCGFKSVVGTMWYVVGRTAAERAARTELE
jgi:hypothetical protein